MGPSRLLAIEEAMFEERESEEKSDSQSQVKNVYNKNDKSLSKLLSRHSMPRLVESALDRRHLTSSY